MAIKLKQLKFWQHLLIYFFCIFIAAGILFYITTLLYHIEKKGPVYRVDFFKIITYILKHTDFKERLIHIKLKELLSIFVTNLFIGIFTAYFLPIRYYIFMLKKSLKQNIRINKKIFLLPVVTVYLAHAVLYTKIYWTIYNLFPVTKLSSIVFVWGVIIFHGIFEEGVHFIITFYFANLFLYLYENSERNYKYLLEYLESRFNTLIKNIPVIISFLFIAAIIECLDLGSYFK